MDAVDKKDGGEDGGTRGAESVRSAFAHVCGGQQKFLVTHPFGEQCYLPSTFEEPVHANLMFGGVVFGKAVFGLLQRAHIFLSYAWDESESNATQKAVSLLKHDIESNTRLLCWMDLERMGAGCLSKTEMQEGVQLADVFICCLTDRYLTRPNCLHELDSAKAANKLIVPLLLDGWTEGNSDYAKAFTPDVLRISWKTAADISENSAKLVSMIDSEVRRQIV